MPRTREADRKQGANMTWREVIAPGECKTVKNQVAELRLWGGELPA